MAVDPSGSASGADLASPTDPAAGKSSSAVAGAPAASPAPAQAVAAATPVLLKPNTGPFTKLGKRYDPLSRPFHRINSPTYDEGVDSAAARETRKRPTGLGRDCGCRNADDFKSSVFSAAIVDAVVDGFESAVAASVPGSKAVLDQLEKQLKSATKRDFKQELKDFLSTLIEKGLFGSFMKFVPSWVPVNRRGFGPNFDAKDAHNVVNGREAEVEIEGFLGRSYQTHHHRPYTQWSRYYQWAFHVIPERGYRHLVGEGNNPNEADSDIERTNDRTEAIEIYGGFNAQLECLLDIGAFSTPPGDLRGGSVLTHPGIFYHKSWPFWPQSGDWFWAAGRYVYDCTHATLDSDKNTERHPTLINPTKAFATGRYEAHLFEESDEPIPVTRFSFFACKKGGYWDFEGDHIAFNGENYEFLVDLPPVPDEVVSYDVGQVADFALNTLVIRPRLLKTIEFAPYDAAAESPIPKSKWFVKDPIIQFIKAPKGALPRMVKVTIPMKDVPADKDAYGFTLTMGWLSPGAPTGVKKVTVKLNTLTLLQERKNLRMSVCINGRWIFVPTANPGKQITGPRDSLQQFPDDAGLVFFLPLEKRVRITAHGMQRLGFGQFLEEKPTADSDSRKDRRLAVGGVINVDHDTEEAIKTALKTKLGEVIPERFWGKFKKVQEVLDDDTFRNLLGKAASDLVGQRRIAVWEQDVDFQETDNAKKNDIACAVAREMKVFPLALFNNENAPMGFLEFGAFNAGTTPQVPQELDVLTMVGRLQKQNNAITTVEFHALRCFQTAAGGFLVFEQNRDDDDYLLKITATIAEPDPPK
jgi:hypothetical protein